MTGWAESAAILLVVAGVQSLLVWQAIRYADRRALRREELRQRREVLREQRISRHEPRSRVH